MCCLLQGTKPEVRTYNTIISACNRSGQPENALRVYERMLADGAQPTATTYTALISAYGKTGKVCWHQDVGDCTELFWLAAAAAATRHAHSTQQGRGDFALLLLQDHCQGMSSKDDYSLEEGLQYCIRKKLPVWTAVCW